MRLPRGPTPRRGFTLIETLISVAAAMVVFAAVYVLANCTKILMAKCLAINITSNQVRNTIDRVQLILQQSYTIPVPINDLGVAQSGTLSITGSKAVDSGFIPVVGVTATGTDAKITGTGAGLAFYRVMGGPYVVTVPAGGIPASASSIQVTIDSTAQITPPIPQPGDILSIYTTAILGGTTNQVYATVASTSPDTVQTGNRTYTVNLTPPLRYPPPGVSASGTNPFLGTAVAGTITQLKDSENQPITPTGILLRPTALVLVYPSTPVTLPPSTPELRLIDSFTLVGGTAVEVNPRDSNHIPLFSVLTREIQPAVSTSGTDSTPSGFGLVKMNSGRFASAILHVRSQNYDRILANKQRKDFSTFMGVGTLIPLKSQSD